MALQTKHFYAFGPFRLDAEKRVLVRDGKPVSLAPKTVETLLVLVESAGHLLEKDDLIKRIWPDAFVEEGNLNKNISFLRKVLGEWDGGREYIETIPKRGYRFVAPVSEVTHAEGDSQAHTSAGANLIGKKVSHYRVLEIIGGGGMGLVYKAEDLKLGRRVALKFLPEELASDSVTLKRFEREAQTASSLNHPNICTIYEIEEHEGQPFLAMELLEGETLRDRLAAGEGALPLKELLDIALQVSDGLEAAHERGIIHRDIKPANIFLTNKGICKILDFGLAKLATPASEIDPEPEDKHPQNSATVQQARPASTGIDATLTRTGVAMGTAGYMSPEQVRGEKLDARTDLFSFGLVLYEMATGQRAFAGGIAAILKDAILNHTPAPVHDLNAALPPKIEHVITKAIEKDRELRYQSATDIRAELGSMEDSSRQDEKNSKRYRRLRLFAAVTVLVVLLAAAVAFLNQRRQPAPRPELKQTQLTANSSENEVENGAISPEGRYLAYYDVRGMHMKLLETGEVQNVRNPDDFQEAQKVEWQAFPLSSTKFLAGAEVLGGGYSVWTFSVMGGELHKLRDDAGVPSVSPDGSTIAFLTNIGKVGAREVWVMDSNGKQARKVYETDENNDLQIVDWSPNGDRLVYWKEDRTGDKLKVELESQDIHGGPATLMLSDSKLWSFKWLPGGRLIYSLQGPDISGQTCNVWEMRVDESTGEPKGAPLQLTNWTGVCTGFFTATADGKRLVFNKFWIQKSVYTGDLANNLSRLVDPRRLTLSDGQEKPVGWTANGKSIVFVSNANGTWGIYKQSPGRESAETILTGLASPVYACMSPDGEWVLYEVFTGWSAGRLMRISVNGGAPESVLTLTMPPEPNWYLGMHSYERPRCAKSPAKLCAIAERTPDGSQLVFTGFDPIKGRGRELLRFNIEPTAAYKWDLSPDGARIALLERSKAVVHILSLTGGADRQITVDGWKSLETMDWAADGKGLFISSPKKGSSVLLYVNLDGRANPLWEQSGEQEGDKDIYVVPSPEGRHLAMYGWTMNSNMWMLENF